MRNVPIILHVILDDAHFNGYIPVNPYRKIKKLTAIAVERDYLRIHEIARFLEKCEPQSFALFHTAIFTGMRRGELLKLLWGDVDWFNSRIKKSKERGKAVNEEGQN